MYFFTPHLQGHILMHLILKSFTGHLKRVSPSHPEKVNLEIDIFNEFGRWIWCSLDQNIGHLAHVKMVSYAFESIS